MAITTSDTAAAPAVAEPAATEAAPARRRRAAPPVEVKPEAAAPATTGIVPSTGGIRPTANRPGRAPAQAAVRDMDAPIESWAHTGDEAAQRSLEEAARREEEKSQRVYWPRRFELGIEVPKNQADVIILDTRPGPRMYLHMMRGPRDSWPNTPEPCPRELEICPVCPPNGEHHSVFTMLLTVMNIAGYNNARTGQFVPATKEIMLPRSDAHMFFDQLQAEHGSLRGIQLLMKRTDKFSPRIGTPTFVAKHSEEDLVSYLKVNNLYDEVLNDDDKTVRFEAGSLIQPFDYFSFAKKPSATDLALRYGGSLTPGSEAANNQQGGNGQFGGGRYQPQPMARGGAPSTNFGGFGGGAAPGAVLDDDVPF